MRKETGEIVTISKMKHVCDACEADLYTEYDYSHKRSQNLVRFDTSYSEYGDDFGDDLEFCSLACLSKYLKKNKIWYNDSEGILVRVFGSVCNGLIEKLSCESCDDLAI